MQDFEKDIEVEAKKIDAKIKKLQEEKAKLKERIEAEKQTTELAFKVGKLLVMKFEGKPFEYKEFEALLDEVLKADFDRQYFGLKPLADDDPRKPKKRGRKKKEEA